MSSFNPFAKFAAPTTTMTTTSSAALLTTRVTSLSMVVSNNVDDNNSGNRRVTRQQAKLERVKEEEGGDEETGLKAAAIEVQAETVATAVTPSPKKKSRTKRTSSTNSSTTRNKKKKKSTPPEPGSKTPPEGWENVYSLVQELRNDKSAPVDDAGAEVLPERHQGERVFRFQVLIALMLSSQTKDAVVGAALRDLQQHGLTVENIAHNTTPEQLNKLIGKVGFHNNKTKYIKAAVQVLIQKYDGDIPKTAQEMMDDLPGVGPKMAFIAENIAWGTTSGIGIDTHMHRMFPLIQWVPKTCKNPEQTRVELEAWLPRTKWGEVNYLWVGLGQEVQQFKPKILRKALDCSRPKEALQLLRRLGLDPLKEGEKNGWKEEVKQSLSNKPC